MVELHGWITVRESYKVDDEGKNISIIVRRIEEKISLLGWDTNLLDIRYYNGTPALSIALFTNRINESINQTFELVKFVCREAKGSYGIIYMYDDESDKAFDEFKVYIVCKGKICEKQDKFLSPLMQKVYQK
ncbi:MAG: Imm7 family immunity protein [Eubacteriales bacterium]|nr:Imm7 family immunity protein [Eubacteriales bacterium]